MYETDVGKDIPSLEDYKYGVEQLFIDLLAASKFRTMVRMDVAVGGAWGSLFTKDS